MDDRSRQRLLLLGALDAALARGPEVLHAVWESADEGEAVTSVRRLLDCDETAAQAVLDLSWRRATRESRDRIARERQQLQRESEAR